MKLLTLLLATWCAGCDGGNGPISPAAQELVIVSDASALPVGEHMLLRAEVRSAGQRARSVQPRWSVSNSAVAVIGQDGALRGLAIGAVAVTAQYETLQAHATFAIVANVAGTWTGQATIRECRKLLGPGPDACRMLIGAVQSIDLRNDQLGDRMSGRMTLGVKIGTFEGRLSEDTVTVKAKLTRDEDRATFTIEEWMLRFTGAELVTVGQLRVDEQSTNIFGPQTLVLFYSVSPLRREPPVP